MLKGMRTNHRHEQDKKRLVTEIAEKDEEILRLDNFIEEQ